MTQPDLFSKATGIVLIPTAILKARENASRFSQDFLDWLPGNLHVFDAFAGEAFKIINRGYTHYSSYTIVEVLRHHSAVTEASGEWKINNNHRPYLPRLFDLVYPQHAGLFEYRVTTKPGQKDV